LGLLAREVFSFWTGHPYDFELWVRTGYWVARGVTPYASMPAAPGLSFANAYFPGGNPAIAYLPFWPLLLAGIYDLFALLGSPTPFLYYFMIKQPIIICDILLAYFLFRYVERRGSDKASFVLKFWLFSPFNIILTGIWGMFDAIPMLFIVFALMARPGTYRGFWAGMATFAKSIPLIFTVPLSWGPRPVRSLALALGIPIVASLVIVTLEGWQFSVVGTTLQSTLATGRLSLSMWELVFYWNYVGLLPDSSLNFFAWAGYIWVAAVAVATYLGYRWFGWDTERGMVHTLILVTLAFLLLRGQVNEQYSVYLFAFALIDIALWSPQRVRLLLASLAAVLTFHVINDIALIRYITPVYPQAQTIETNIINAIAPERNAGLFLAAMVFWALNIYYFWSLYREREVRSEDFKLLPRASRAPGRRGGAPRRGPGLSHSP